MINKFLKAYFIVTIALVTCVALADFIEEYRGTLKIGADPDVTAVEIAPGGTTKATVDTNGLTLPNNTALQFKDSAGTAVRGVVVTDQDDTRIIAKSGENISFAFGSGNGTEEFRLNSSQLLSNGSMTIGNTLDGTVNSQALQLGASINQSAAESAIIQLQSHAYGGNLDLYATSAGKLRYFGNTGTPKLEFDLEGRPNFKGTMGDSTKDPATQAPDDWVQIEINGTTYYLPAYLP